MKSLRIHSKSKIVAYALVFFLVIVLRLITAPLVQAHCPLCVAGAGIGLTLTRWVGVDDSISGIWLAAFLGAMAFWSEALIKDRELKLKLRPLIYIGIFAATIWSFYKFNLILRMVQIFGFDKLTFGMIVGGAVFYLVDLADDLIIKKSGKVFFPYQRIIVSLGSIVLVSLAMYVLINYFI